MHKHSEIGERILAKVASYAEIASIVRHHHERVDGGGYPDGLADEEIPLLSRIIAVADAYNAMTSDRPYRDAMPSRVARLRLAQAVDSQLTHRSWRVRGVLAMATEPYRMGRSPEFTFEWQLRGSRGGSVHVTPTTARPFPRTRSRRSAQSPRSYYELRACGRCCPSVA